MAAAPAISPDHGFLDCPFDDEYTETFRALIFAIRACGFQARSARELDDSGQPRIEKLYGLIKECRYGIRSAHAIVGSCPIQPAVAARKGVSWEEMRFAPLDASALAPI